MEEKARIFAEAAHAGQERLYGAGPYIQHPARVANALRVLGEPEEVVAAAWLHDVIEDCGVTEADLILEFGLNVARLVVAVSNVYGEGYGNRAARKAAEARRLAGIPVGAKNIKLADMADNIPSIVDNDPEFAKVYLREKEELLEVLYEPDINLYLFAYVKGIINAGKKELGVV